MKRKLNFQILLFVLHRFPLTKVYLSLYFRHRLGQNVLCKELLKWTLIVNSSQIQRFMNVKKLAFCRAVRITLPPKLAVVVSFFPFFEEKNWFKFYEWFNPFLRFSLSLSKLNKNARKSFYVNTKLLTCQAIL